MKKETYANKLAALLGLDQTIVEKSGYVSAEKKAKNLNAAIGISEEEIQNFRAAQGIVYFLQAPELFKAKVCPHCKEGFLVSRQYVAFCSYTCIRLDLESKGIKWSKGDDIEALANDPAVYEGNEPLWIGNLDRLKAVLATLEESQLSSTSPAPTE